MQFQFHKEASRAAKSNKKELELRQYTTQIHSKMRSQEAINQNNMFAEKIKTINIFSIYEHNYRTHNNTLEPFDFLTLVA